MNEEITPATPPHLPANRGRSASNHKLIAHAREELGRVISGQPRPSKRF